MIPIHPQVCPDHADQLRWRTPPGILPGQGRVTVAPGALGGLLWDGTLAEVLVEPAAVVTRLGADRSWSTAGPRVRTALHAALADPAGWQVVSVAGGRAHDDALLSAVVREILNGQLGQFARSHGGAIELVRVADGVVDVRLGGACAGCPAARVTMHGRLERQIRARCAGLRQVRDVSGF